MLKALIPKPMGTRAGMTGIKQNGGTPEGLSDSDSRTREPGENLPGGGFHRNGKVTLKHEENPPFA
jgi:hypothetical protein